MKFAIAALSLLSTLSNAGTDGADMQVYSGGGFSTYKSKVVAMNDTSTAIGYGLKIRAGTDGDLGVHWDEFTNKTKFALNSSETKISFQDTSILFNVGSFFLGPVFSKVTIDVNNQGTTTLSGLGSGYGVNTGFSIDTGKASTVYFEGKMITTSILKAEDSVKASMGSRTDFKIGGIIPITKKLLSLDLAWRMQSWPVTISGQTGKESLYTTWLGLLFNLNI
ncbi:MAG: hypothetical protein WCI18_02045 [Pseudomonadota bacterium]